MLLADLLELPYTGQSAFGRGLLADDFRREYARHGERIRWFKAFQANSYNPANSDYSRASTAAREKDGRIYTEQTLCADGSLVANARVMLYQTHDDIQDSEVGLLPKGSTALSTLPDEIPLARLDRVILLDSPQTIRRQIVRAASGDDPIFNEADRMTKTPVVSIRRVWQGATAYVATTNYTLVSNAVHWVSGAPTAGTSYGIEVTYSPVYTVVAEIQQPHAGADGELMPLRVALVKLEPGQ